MLHAQCVVETTVPCNCYKFWCEITHFHPRALIGCGFFLLIGINFEMQFRACENLGKFVGLFHQLKTHLFLGKFIYKFRSFTNIQCILYSKWDGNQLKILACHRMQH